MTTAGSDALLKKTGTVSAAVGANWGSLVESIYVELHRRAGVDRDLVRRALCECIRFYHSHRFTFNEGTGYFWLLEGQREYKAGSDRYNGEDFDGETDATSPEKPDAGQATVPVDIIRIKKDGLKIRGEGEDWWTENLIAKEIGVLRHMRRTTQYQSTPRIYSYYGDPVRFEVYPTPNRDFVSKMTYKRNIGIPEYTFDETNGWTFYEPWTGAVISNNFSNEFIRQGSLLLRAWVKWYVYSEFLDDVKQASNQASVVDIAYSQLVKESSEKQSHSEREATPV